MENNKEKVYVFDVCGTLFHSNTTYDFLKYYFKKRKIIKYFISKLALSFPAKILIVILSRVGFHVKLREFLIGLLKGENKEHIQDEAHLFVLEYLQYRVNGATHEILIEALKNNEKVILASASLEPVVSAIAISLQVSEQISSILEHNGSILTGKLKLDMVGEKLEYLQSFLDLKNCEMVVLTDNLEDIALVKAASKAFIVSKNRFVRKWKASLKTHTNTTIIHV